MSCRLPVRAEYWLVPLALPEEALPAFVPVVMAGRAGAEPGPASPAGITLEIAGAVVRVEAEAALGLLAGVLRALRGMA